MSACYSSPSEVNCLTYRPKVWQCLAVFGVLTLITIRMSQGQGQGQGQSQGQGQGHRS